jgi:hypothetical protein
MFYEKIPTGKAPHYYSNVVFTKNKIKIKFNFKEMKQLNFLFQYNSIKNSKVRSCFEKIIVYKNKILNMLVLLLYKLTI